LKKLLIILILILFLIANLGCQSKDAEQGYHNIDSKTAYERLQNEKEIVLLDVRTQAEYDEKHIPGSILIPVDILRENVEEKIMDKETVIFVYCRSGNRSTTASEILVELGYQKVYNLGGIKDWKYETQSNN